MNPHQIALDAVKDRIIGTKIVEVANRVPWGFHASINLVNVTADDFLAKDLPFNPTTVILHILMGEGMIREQFAKVLKKAVGKAPQVIVLEHNPDSADWDDNSYVTDDFRKEIRNLPSHMTFFHALLGPTKRNEIYAIGTVEGLSFPDARHHTSWHTVTPGVHPQFGVYTMTSEKATLDPMDIVKIQDSWYKHRRLYTVAGGRTYIDLCNQLEPQELMIYDQCLGQLVYDHLLYQTESYSDSLSGVMEGEEFASCLSSWNEAMDKPLGRWRHVSQEDLVSRPPFTRHMLAGIDYINETAEPGSVVFTSTIEPLPEMRKDLTIISALDPRDRPRVTQVAS